MISTVFLFFYLSLLHPLHLSVCDVYHNQEKNALEISQRLFVDDLEDAIRKGSGGKADILQPKDPEQLSQLIGKYILQHFSVYLNQEEAQLQYLGYEVEEDVVWVYLEVLNVSDFESIGIRNTVFFELFDDQLNLINVKKNGRIRSLKLEPEQKQDQLIY